MVVSKILLNFIVQIDCSSNPKSQPTAYSFQKFLLLTRTKFSQIRSEQFLKQNTIFLHLKNIHRIYSLDSTIKQHFHLTSKHIFIIYRPSPVTKFILMNYQAEITFYQSFFTGGVKLNCCSTKLNRIQFSSLEIFISKKVGNRKN